MAAPVYILGISCYYHDSAAAILRDGQIVAAAQEERFNREKYSYVFPVQAINYCLQEAGCTVYDLAGVAFYEKPFLKLARVLAEHVHHWPRSFPNFLAMTPTWLQDRLTLPLDLERQIGFTGPTWFFKHHLSHAACAFYGSGFEEAGILTVDGIGEWASSTWGEGRGSSIRIAQEMRYPNSLGLLYSIVTTYLGFKVFEGEGKIMALAAYGQPTYLDAFKRCVATRPDGSCRLDPDYFALNRGTTMFNQRFVDLLGPAREPNGEITQHHKDVAASLQALTETCILDMARYVHARTGHTRLAAAGGVFLNVLTNTRILRDTPITELYVPPPAGDAGTAIGAAWLAWHGILGHPRVPGHRMRSALLGPGYSDTTVRRMLQREGVPFKELPEADLARFVAERVADGQIVAWFQGRMEMGPRALGARSVLADTRKPWMREHLNNVVKFREWFRPYGVAVLRDQMHDWFDMDVDSPYMLLTGNVHEDKRDLIPSAMHVDGTTRLQSVTVEEDGLYARVVEEFFKLTGVPMIINTSYNIREPIVCTPEQGLATFRNGRFDWLAMGSFLVDKRDLAGGPESTAAAH